MVADPGAQVPEYAVVVSEKGGQERREVFQSPELTIGRVQGNDLVLPKGNVSKRHARILYREGRFIVTDLNSTNGTYVNRRRIAQATIIREGDKVYVGDFVIRVEETSTSERSSPASSDPAHLPGPSFPVLGETEFSTGGHPMPGWERPSSLEDLSRPSSGPPRVSEAPASAADSSHSSEHFSDLAAGHRQAVAQVIEGVTKELGRPDLEPSEEYAELVREKVSQVSDQLLVDGHVPVGTSAEAIGEQAVAEILGLGPLLDLLADPVVVTISAARYDELVATRDGRQQTVPPGFSSGESFELALRRLCLRNDRELPSGDVVELVLAGGVRVSLLRGKVAPGGPLFKLQKPRKITSSLDDLVRRGAISRMMATFLSQCVSARLNILVVGPRDQGTHTVLSALCAAASRERVIVASDFDEIAAENERIVRLDLKSYDGDLRRVFEVASGLSQARLAVTLTTPSLAAAAVEAMGSGISGTLASFRASNLTRGLLRLPADVAAERAEISLEAATGWVLSGFDLGLEVARLRDGRIRVLRIAELAMGPAGGIDCHDIFRFSVSRVAAGGAVEGTFSPSGHVPKVATQLQAAGIRVETTLFSRPPSN